MQKTIRNTILIASIFISGCDIAPSRNSFIVSSIVGSQGGHDVEYCIRAENNGIIGQKFYLNDSTNTIRVGDTLILVKK